MGNVSYRNAKKLGMIYAFGLANFKWKLIFQPRFGRVDVNLLEGNPMIIHYINYINYIIIILFIY